MLPDWMPYVVGTVIIFGSWRIIKGGIKKIKDGIKKSRKRIESGDNPVKHL